MNTQLSTYTKSLIPEPFTIFGVELRPLSLGHLFLMNRFDCKFASEDPNEKGGIDDLLLGVAICCRSFGEFNAFIRDGQKFTKWCKRWSKEINKQVKREAHYDVLYRFDLFKKYLKDSIVVPKYWELKESEEAGESGTHWTHSVFNILMSEIGYSQQEALDMPVARALSEYFRFLERNGVIQLMNDADIKFIEQKECVA